MMPNLVDNDQNCWLNSFSRCLLIAVELTSESIALFNMCLDCIDSLKIRGICAFEKAQLFASSFEAVKQFELALGVVFNSLPVNAGRWRGIIPRRASILQIQFELLRSNLIWIYLLEILGIPRVCLTTMPVIHYP